MTPKEKAEELVNRFMDIKNVKLSDYSIIYLPTAKHCALIAVDEILNNFGTLIEGKQHYVAYSTIKFYEEVKQEIEKL